MIGALSVSIGIIIIQMTRAKPQNLLDVVGVWVMTTVPLLSTADTAGTILPYLSSTTTLNNSNTKCAVAVLVTAYMGWSLAMSELIFILTVFFYRLISLKLPPSQPLVMSSFLPVAALSNAAFAIHKLSIYLAGFITATAFAPTQVETPPLSTANLDATAEVIHWIGILLSLGLLAHATFCKPCDLFLFLFFSIFSLFFPPPGFSNFHQKS